MLQDKVVRYCTHASALVLASQGLFQRVITVLDQLKIEFDTLIDLDLKAFESNF